ncbi:MAG TPA: TonB-dependent receptor, partial [Flavobacteriaceae bacterium]|nr:TonB-dependent receptor [Flavobacteriaceae bacterium]
MKTPFVFAFIVLFFLGFNATAQKATVKGIVLDEFNQPLSGVTIQYEESGKLTDLTGFYLIEIPADKEVTVIFSHVGFEKVQIKVNLRRNEDFEFNPVMLTDVEQIEEVVISSRRNKQVQGVVNISPEAVRKIPGANAGVENLLKSLPGVSSNNELSTQYSVRGGNYDENLVYVNEIEVYRPFLIRSGQQEGLSFVNSDLTSNVDFSAGGFQAKYGDRLSSVLDITYRRPAAFDASADFSFLGGSVSAGGISKDGRFTAIGGLRYRDNSLFVNSMETETDFKPIFADAQTYLTYKFSNKLELGFLGNIAINDYKFRPLARQTNFGTIANPIALVVLYEGQEHDRYDTYFGALKGTYIVNDNFTTKLIGSIYHTKEQEYFDILARYSLGDVNTNIGSEELGDVQFSRAIGSQLTHARNDLDALIINLEHKGDYTVDDHLFQYGIKYTHEDIRDRVKEYEIIDSAGFSIRPIYMQPNDQPYSPYDLPLVPFNDIRAFNNVQIDRFSGFAQWSYRTT